VGVSPLIAKTTRSSVKWDIASHFFLLALAGGTERTEPLDRRNLPPGDGSSDGGGVPGAGPGPLALPASRAIGSVGIT
jgi:hypothetical protein